jgi:Dolichyl-phosphate-mannose-protein mannosyltransferase
VRLLSVLAGALTAGLVVVYGRRLLPLWAAGTAGVLVALAAQLVARGHELRAYALFALLSVVFAFALEAAAGRRGGLRFLALAACVAAGLLTHYFFALLVVAGLVWARSVRAAAASAAGLILFLPWLPSLLDQYENGRFSWIEGFDLVEAAAAYSAFFWNPGPLYVATEDAPLGAGEALARLALLGVVLAGCAVLSRRPGRGRLVAALALGPVALAAAVWLAGADVFTARNVLCAAPFTGIAVAAAVAALPRPATVPATAGAVALVTAGLAYERTLAPPDYEALAGALVAEGWTFGNPVAVYGGAHEHLQLGSAYALRSPVAWYLPGRPFLRLPREEAAPCGEAYVLAPSGRAGRLVRAGGVDAAVDGVGVTRIPCEPGLPERVEADGGVWFVPTRD